jgi:hypothetical protein
MKYTTEQDERLKKAGKVASFLNAYSKQAIKKTPSNR